MDTLLLEYKLKVHNIPRPVLLEVMGWSEGTRQARCLRGENWTVEELRTLLQVGFSFEEIREIFFALRDHENGQNEKEGI